MLREKQLIIFSINSLIGFMKTTQKEDLVSDIGPERLSEFKTALQPQFDSTTTTSYHSNKQ